MDEQMRDIGMSYEFADAVSKSDIIGKKEMKRYVRRSHTLHHS